MRHLGLGSIFALLVAAGCGGERVPQEAACAEYVACLQARDDARGSSTNVERFLPEGPCWGSVEAAELCTPSCERGLTFLQEAESDLPTECMP